MTLNIARFVAIADTITSGLGLQVNVSHEAWASADAYGKPTYSTAVTRPAIVDFKQQRRPSIQGDPSGEEKLARAHILFPRPVAIDPRDRLTLPDGTTGPIVDIAGFMGASAPYYREVWLG